MTQGHQCHWWRQLRSSHIKNSSLHFAATKSPSTLDCAWWVLRTFWWNICIRRLPGWLGEQSCCKLLADYALAARTPSNSALMAFSCAMKGTISRWSTLAEGEVSEHKPGSRNCCNWGTMGHWGTWCFTMRNCPWKLAIRGGIVRHTPLPHMETRELVLSWGCLNNFTPMFCMANLTSGPTLAVFQLHRGPANAGSQCLDLCLANRTQTQEFQLTWGARQQPGDFPAEAGWHRHWGDSPYQKQTNKWSAGYVAKLIFIHTELFAKWKMGNIPKLKRRGDRSKQGDLGNPPLPPYLPDVQDINIQIWQGNPHWKWPLPRLCVWPPFSPLLTQPAMRKMVSMLVIAGSYDQRKFRGRNFRVTDF